MRFDWKNLSTRDRVVSGGAAVAFIALFLPWWSVSFEGFSYSFDGWSLGLTGWAGGMLLTTAGVLLVLERSGRTLFANLRPSVLVAGLAALGLLLVILRWVRPPHYRGVDVGARYGLYITLIAGIVEVAAAVLELRAPDASAPNGPEP